MAPGAAATRVPRPGPQGRSQSKYAADARRRQGRPETASQEPKKLLLLLPSEAECTSTGAFQAPDRHRACCERRCNAARPAVARAQTVQCTNTQDIRRPKELTSVGATAPKKRLLAPEQAGDAAANLVRKAVGSRAVSRSLTEKEEPSASPHPLALVHRFLGWSARAPLQQSRQEPQPSGPARVLLRLLPACCGFVLLAAAVTWPGRKHRQNRGLGPFMFSCHFNVTSIATSCPARSARGPPASSR